MATVDGIRARLKDSFTEQQADLLAHVVVEAHADYVTRGDFQALTSVVRELAEAQQRTEVRMEELADAQRGLAAAQERTEARMESLAAAQGRTEARMESLAVAQERTEARMESLAVAQERTEARMEELAEAQREFTWAMRDTRKQLGGLSQSVGYGLEAYAMERIPRILSRQMPFVEEASGPEQFVSASGVEDDVDVVVRGTLAGRPVVFLCEAKTNITPLEVRDFLPTADRVRGQVGCDDVRVLYFAYRANSEARAAVAAAGGYLAFPHTIVVRPTSPA